jgi:tRNA (guanine26-N2/guanine27-N2)-dimethyltransferase
MPGSIKTDAPWSVIWQVMTEYIRQKAPIAVHRYKPNMPGWKILDNAGLLVVEEERLEDDPDVALGLGKIMGDYFHEEQGIKNGPEGGKDKDGNPKEAESKGEPNAEEMEGVEGEAEEEMPDPKEPRPINGKIVIFNKELERMGQEAAGPKMARWQVNPRPNWGPLTKASRT